MSFVCFSFYILFLLVITFSSLKLHAENNASMFILLTGSVILVTSGDEY